MSTLTITEAGVQRRVYVTTAALLGLMAKARREVRRCVVRRATSPAQYQPQGRDELATAEAELAYVDAVYFGVDQDAAASAHP